MSWTTQCTAPYIIGIHSSLFATLNPSDLGDVIVVKIDEPSLESRHDDLNLFPKHLTRNLKKGIQQKIRLAGDHLARVFLRAMACAIGNYGAGIIPKDEKLDFDRDLYLDQYRDTPLFEFMSAVANTQMFEQVSRDDELTFAVRPLDFSSRGIELTHSCNAKRMSTNSIWK